MDTISSEYLKIKRELDLSESHFRQLFEQYCTNTFYCTNKIEWSCKFSSGSVKHIDRFVHVSSTHDRETWFKAGEHLLRNLLPRSLDPDLIPTLRKLSRHSKQLFVGYSGNVEGSDDSERIKLYFSLSGESEGLWSEAKERINRNSLPVSAPKLCAWLYVFVLSRNNPPCFRVDLVYDSIEFRDSHLQKQLRSLLFKEEIDFLRSEIRGIISLRQCEHEMLYSYIEFSREESKFRMLAKRHATLLPQFLERIGGLTWIGIPRGSICDPSDRTITLYTKL